MPGKPGMTTTLADSYLLARPLIAGNITYAKDAVLTRVSNTCAILAFSLDSLNI